MILEMVSYRNTIYQMCRDSDWNYISIADQNPASSLAIES